MRFGKGKFFTLAAADAELVNTPIADKLVAAADDAGVA